MTLNARRVAALVLRQFYLIKGSPARVLPLFAWVAIDVLLWGFITKYLNSIASPGFDFVPMMLGAVLMWDFFTRIMHGVAMALFEDVWSRNFLNIFASPLSVGEYLTALVVTSMLTSSVGLVIMLLIASLGFDLSFFVYGAMFIPFLLVLFLFGVAIGILGSAMVLRLGPAAEWFVWPIPAIISPFAAVFYPLSTLPGWMRAVSLVLPPAHVFEGMRAIVAGGEVLIMPLVSGASLALIYVLGACWTFSRVHRYTVRTGLIARYSAESIS